MNTVAQYEYEPKQQYAAARALTKLTYWRWVIPAIAIVIPGSFILMNLAPHWDELTIGTVLAQLPWVLLGLFYLALIPWQQRRRAKRLPSLDPSVRGTLECGVDDVGLHARGHGLTVDRPWSDLVRAVETDEFFFFFYNKQCAHFIPKRALPPGGVEAVRGLAAVHMGERAKLAAEVPLLASR